MIKYISVVDADTGKLCSQIQPNQFYWYAMAIQYLPLYKKGNTWFCRKMVKPFKNWYTVQVPEYKFCT